MTEMTEIQNEFAAANLRQTGSQLELIFRQSSHPEYGIFLFERTIPAQHESLSPPQAALQTPIILEPSAEEVDIVFHSLCFCR